MSLGNSAYVFVKSVSSKRYVLFSDILLTKSSILNKNCNILFNQQLLPGFFINEIDNSDASLPSLY